MLRLQHIRYAITKWHDVIGHGGRRDRALRRRCALFHTGRLLLLVPSAFEASFGQHIIIAWKESKITQRAVLAAQSWLSGARRVSVVQVGEGHAGELLEAERLLDSMQIEASFNVVSSEGQTIGHQASRLPSTVVLGAEHCVCGTVPA
jgi:hypothetical protein